MTLRRVVALCFPSGLRQAATDGKTPGLRLRGGRRTSCAPSELQRVLRELRASLKSGGVLFSSNPHGNDEEGWNRGRYGSYHAKVTWRGYLSAAGFVELGHYSGLNLN